MIRRSVRIQLVAFAMIAVVSVVYAAYRFGGLHDLFSPPYTIHAHFSDAAGIAPKDEVDELGVNVGEVTGLHPEGNGVMVDLSINHGVRLPSDLHAAIADKSALGEQYVLLTPLNPASPALSSGGEIPVSATSTPVPLQDIIGNLDALAKSVPKPALRTDLRELSTAFAGSGPDLQRLLDQGTALTRTSLVNLSRTISLINTSTTVLRTQVVESQATRGLTQQLADFTQQVRTLDPQIAETFISGVSAADQVTGLLKDNEQILPSLLSSLLTTTDVTRGRLQQVRKTLTLYPWVVQVGASAIRYCDTYHLKSGKPVKSTCHIDPKTGQRIYTGHFAFQTPEGPNDPPYNPCTRGYGKTVHYLPNLKPASGTGHKETANTPPNLKASCRAKPTDPKTPNVRGSQNAQRPPGDTSPDPGGTVGHSAARGSVPSSQSAAGGSALARLGHDLLVIAGLAGPNPPSGAGGLVWLLLGEPTAGAS